MPAPGLVFKRILHVRDDFSTRMAPPGAKPRLKWTTRRRLWTRTRETKSTRTVAVGTVKKSMEASEPRWLSRKVRHVWEGGWRGGLGM
jgi:hypothetical protein